MFPPSIRSSPRRKPILIAGRSAQVGSQEGRLERPLEGGGVDLSVYRAGGMRSTSSIERQVAKVASRPLSIGRHLSLSDLAEGKAGLLW